MTKSEMKISIAMATYNGAKYLHEQLDSFLHQTRQPDELVVCDDCSTDETLEILEEFRRQAPFSVHICRNKVNLGHIRNFEKALSLCVGDMIFLSDQDDVWDPKKLSVVCDCFNENPSLDVVTNDAHYTDEKLNRSGVTVLQKILSEGLGPAGHINGACTAITKRFCDFILPFPDDGCPYHDVYIHRWAFLIGNKHVIDVPLQVWRIHGLNTTANEMVRPEIKSPISRYMIAKNADATNSYLKKADEFRVMGRTLEERMESLLRLPRGRQANNVGFKIEQIVEANASRAKLGGMRWLARQKVILQMAIKGQYRHFSGLKSIAKDILL